MPNMYIDVDTAVTVHANVLPLLDDTTFKDIEEAIAYDAAGMNLNWNFITSAGVITQTNVTPTTGGDYDWTHVGNGIYKIEIPASGGASINNDTEGYGWFSGVCTGVLPWCGPRIGFRAAGLNDLLCDNAYSALRGLTGTALPAAAADGVGGVPISDAGGLDLDTKLANTNEVTAARMGALTDWIDGGRLDLLLDAIPTTAMRGTDNAALAATALSTAVWTAARAGVLTDWIDGGRLDLLLDAIPTTAMRGTDGANTTVPDAAGVAAALIGALNDLSAAQVNAEVLDVINVDALVSGVAVAESLRRIGAITSGVISGAGTGTETFVDYASSVNTIVVTVDASGNRSVIAYN